MSNLLDNYNVCDNLILDDMGRLPVIYWPVTPNFGDLLSPWLFKKITGKEVMLVSTRVRKTRWERFLRRNQIGKFSKQTSSYVAIGSIISRVQSGSVVWGTGSFGDETFEKLNPDATYLSVRGPLTRNLLLRNNIMCPEVYGDPALITPLLFDQNLIEKKYEVGLVLRWSEKEWLTVKPESDDVMIIDLGNTDVEFTLRQILSCKRIITSSLHGLIIADAYGIPSAWLKSNSPRGLEFKYHDYFLTVDKIRKPQELDLLSISLKKDFLLKRVEFDDKSITFDLSTLLDVCPVLTKKS